MSQYTAVYFAILKPGLGVLWLFLFINRLLQSTAQPLYAFDSAQVRRC